MIEKYRIDYSSQAQKDLRDIYTYIAFSLKEKQIAKNLSHLIRREIRSLSTFPERYQKVNWEPWASSGVRQMSVKNYVIYYFVNLDLHAVKIMRIFYGGRDVEQIVNIGEG